MTSKRHLIVNADDFGQSDGVNRGIVEAYENGIVTSASLMVRWPAAVEAAGYSREHPELSLGLHFDLGEWIYRDDTWCPLYEVVSLDYAFAVREEMYRQLATFRSLVGRDPTHLDSHQHVHQHEPVRSTLVALASQLAVPLRHCATEVNYCGSFYGQTGNGFPLPEAISSDGLIEILPTLPLGYTELGCHPGLGTDLKSMYLNERSKELQTLCDPSVRAAISREGIDLCSFAKVKDAQQAL